jgi:hypothetical protein
MTTYYDPDPLGMGLVATLNCVKCGRDRYAEVTSTRDEDVIRLGEGIVALPNVRCPCGERRIRTDWLIGDIGGDICGAEHHGSDEPPPTPVQSATDEPPPTPVQSATSQTRDGYWDTPTAPLPEPLAHQFRQIAGGRQWEADFEKMTVAVLRTGELLMSEEPVLYDLMCGPDGLLRTRPNEESRKIMLANIQERLSDPERSQDALACQRDLARMAALHRGEWSTIPSAFAESMHERYRAFVMTAARDPGQSR